MRSLLPLLIALLSCAEDPTRLAITRQGVLIFPDGGVRTKGITVNAHLGAVITTCPDGGWVAGATGDDSIYVSPLRTRMRSARPFLFPINPLPLACLGTNDALHVLMGGANNTWAVFPDGGSRSVYTQRSDAFDLSRGYLALGNTLGGTVAIFSKGMTATGLTNPTFVSTPSVNGRGHSVSWTARGDLLEGNPTARSAGVFFADATADGGRLLATPFALANPDPTLSGTDFGRVVLVGDLAPDPGEEYVVAAPAVGRVYVYSGQGLAATLTGGPSFGAALALEPTSFGGLHALWIGEPEADQVHRHFAGQTTTFSSPPAGGNASFGAAIAVERDSIAIGAPDYDDGLTVGAGAVFEAVFDAGRGQATQCIAGQTCPLPGCTTGTCIGGVFCEQTDPVGSDCGVGELCDVANDRCVPSLDAGVPLDAGPPDAGAMDGGADAGAPDAGEPDAGVPDAGQPDGGAPDAGGPDAGVDGGVDGPDAGVQVQTFHTCGCTSADLPLLLVALALFRRRVTATR